MQLVHRKLLQMGGMGQDMGEHGMGEHDMGKHDMGKHDMEGHAMDNEMSGHSMAMTFFSSNNVALWFDAWTTESPG